MAGARRIPGLVVAAGGLILLAAVLGLGIRAWDIWVVEGLGRLDFTSPPGLVLFGLLAGAGAFFSPCAFALFPGYVSYQLALLADGGVSRLGRISRAVVLGGACGAGGIAFFLTVGLLLSLVAWPLGWLLVNLKPVLAVLIVLMGILLLAGRSPGGGQVGSLATRLVLPTPKPSTGSAGAMFAYGAVYGLASTACTLPVYVSIVVLPLGSGQIGAALLTFGSFALAMAALMVGTALVVGLSGNALLTGLRASAPWIVRAAGVVLIIVGIYEGYFFFKTGM
jgi:cytochrome c-type biogenesis protein